MKAAFYTEHGSVDVLQLGELPRPPVADDEVLVEVAAAGVNPIDRRLRSGELQEYITRTFPVVPGWDLAGRIVATGAAVSGWNVGDEVAGLAEELRALAEVLSRHERVLVMSDDIYEHVLFDGRDYATMAQVAPEMFDRTLTINGVSKAYAMTGWRIGIAGGPADLIKTMSKVQNQSTGNPSSVSQAAAVAALTGPQELVGERAMSFQRRRDRVVEMLNQAEGLTCRTPEGAFYAYPNIAGLLGRKTPAGQVIETDRDFVMYLMEHAGVATVHGEAYGLSPHIRLSTASSLEELEEACRRIQKACTELT